MSNLITQFYWQDNAGTARQALDSLSGAIYGNYAILDVQQQGVFNSTIAQRTGRISAGTQNGQFASAWQPVQVASAGEALPNMRQTQPSDPLEVWLQGMGSFGTLNADASAAGGTYTIGGLSGGADYRVCPDLMVGLGVGYSHDNAQIGGPGAHGTVDDYAVGGYGGYVHGPWHLDGILSYGFLQTTSTRYINVGTIQQGATANYDGGVLLLSTEGGYAIQFKWLTVEPTLGVDYAHLWQDGFTETGAAPDGNNYGLNVNRSDMNSVRTDLGVRLAAQFGDQGGMQFIPALHALWQHEYSDRYANVDSSFIGGSGTFQTQGVELGADTALLGGGLTVAFTKQIHGFVNYEAALNQQLNSSTVSGGLSYSW
jgi:outer membrane autotransporter protein